MDNIFPSDLHLHPHLPSQPHPHSESNQHALYRISASHSLAPVAPSSHMYHAPLRQQRRPSMEQDMYPNSCIPSLVPPGVDPTSVDFRTFYPYVPNEVKHRKRTTRSQLKVLEGTFKEETKPNAAMRKRLALQLNMTARGVQVWFQNRRAKEKNLANKNSRQKGSAAVRVNRTNRSTPQSEDRTPSPDHSPSPSDIPTSCQEEEDPQSPAASNARVSEASAETSSSEVTTRDSLVPQPTFARLSEHNISSAPPQFSNHGYGLRRSLGHAAVVEPDPINLRRGSLPTIVYSRLPGSSGPSYESLAKRRSSVDTSLARLAAHPYAHVAMAANSALFGGTGASLRPPSRYMMSTCPPERYGEEAPTFTNPWQHRPALQHRASMPHALNAHGYYVSGNSSRAPADIRAFDLRSNDQSPLSRHPSTTPSPLTNGLRVPERTSFVDGRPCVGSSRPLGPPIPGPLPCPNFSFGQAPIHTAASTSPSSGTDSGDSPEQLSASLNAYAFPGRGEDGDGEDDSASNSYCGYSSRFGSVASITGSESSATSAYYSDVGSVNCVPDNVDYPHGFNPDLRRESCASGYLDLSGLNLAASSGPAAYAPHENRSVDASLLHEGHGGDQNATSTYPSPGSTVSPGGSPRPEEVGPAIPISRSSELAYALKVKQEESNGMVFASPGSVDDSKAGTVPSAPYDFIGTSSTSEPAYPQSASSSSSSLGSYELVPSGKFLIDTNVGAPSVTGHYSPTSYHEADGFAIVNSHPVHYQEHGMAVGQYPHYRHGSYSGSVDYGGDRQGYLDVASESGGLGGTGLYASYT